MREFPSLTETSFFILLCLAPGPKHGYAILREVEVLSEGRVRLATGTLYSALKRMLEEAWLEQVKVAGHEKTGRKRKYYRLTDLGRRILEAESTRLQRLSKLAQLQEAASKR